MEPLERVPLCAAEKESPEPSEWGSRYASGRRQSVGLKQARLRASQLERGAWIRSRRSFPPFVTARSSRRCRSGSTRILHCGYARSCGWASTRRIGTSYWACGMATSSGTCPTLVLTARWRAGCSQRAGPPGQLTARSGQTAPEGTGWRADQVQSSSLPPASSPESKEASWKPPPASEPAAPPAS